MKIDHVASGALAFAFFGALGANAQPERAKPYVENENRFDPLKVKLTQLHPNEVALRVTSADGVAFDAAEILDGADGPWRLKAEFECPSAFGLDGGGQGFGMDGEVTDLTLQTIGFPDLLSYGPGGVLPHSTSGAVEISAWGSSYADNWIDNEKTRAIDACNAAAAGVKAKNGGMSMRVAMSRVGLIYPYANLADGDNVAGRAKLRARCDQMTYQRDGADWIYDHTLEWDAETAFLKLRLPVKCDAPLKRPQSASSSLSAGFGVTQAALYAEPSFVKGQCPRTVKFRGVLKASGAGDVKYRIRGSDGTLGRVNTLKVSSAGPSHFEFEREFGKKATGGLVAPTDPKPSPPDDLAVPGPDGDPKGPTIKAPSASGGGGAAAASGSIATATAKGEHSGWMRIDIVSPTTGVKKSPEAFYKVVCQEPVIPSGLSVRDTGAPVRKRPGKSK